MSAVVAMLFAFLPGAPLAAMTLERRSDVGTLYVRSIVLSILLVSAIGWAPLGNRVELTLWVGILSIASIWGLVIFTRSILESKRAPSEAIPRGLQVASALALLFVVLILVVRPNIDWDAIDYYLLAAMDAVLNGHYTIHFSHYVEIAAHAPNTVLPAMPSLYACAIQLAHIFHEEPDNAIRLIAMVFISGIWQSSRRLARGFMSPSWAEIAGLLAILLPGILFVEVSMPLLLDLSFTFLILEFVSLLLTDRAEPRSFLLIGLTASVLTVDKIDGLPSFILIALAFFLTSVPTGIAAIGAIVSVLALASAASHVGLLSAATPASIFIAIVVVGILFTYCVARRRPRTSIRISNLPWLALGLLPAFFEIVKLVHLTGSPAGFYLPALAHNQSVLWHQAVAMVNSAGVYAPSTLPGTPANFGIGLILWWGFAPPIMVAALWGAYKAIRDRSPILSIVAACLIFEFAFLTIFGLQDFRHILPVVPLVAIMAAYGFSRFPLADASKWLAFIIAALASLPFAWDAQQRFFGDPSPIFVALRIDQWQALSNGGLISIEMITIAAWAAIFYIPTIQSANRWLTSRSPRVLVTIGVLMVAAWFAPVLKTAITPGFHEQYLTVLNNQDNGYVPGLRAALTLKPDPIFLTYQNFGVTWFSHGGARRLELTDATDLEVLLPLLKARHLRALNTLQVTAAILPAPRTPAFAALARLAYSLGHPELLSLYDTSKSTIVQYGKWYVITPKTTKGWF